jgi:flagellar basal-body rod modification protein FlgD
MSTSPTSAVSDIFNSVQYTAQTRTPVKTLGQEDFLKLLTTQMANQDPMKPMEDTEFISQMANFTSLEQTKTMSQTMASLLNSQNTATASSYIGKQVTLRDAAGDSTSGIVSEVRIKEGKPYLVVGDKEYDATTVTKVANPATSATTTQS